MKVLCIRLNSGEEILGRVVEKSVLLTGSSSVSPFDGNGPFEATGKVTLEKVRGITAQPINKNEMAIAFFPWALGNQDGEFTFILDNCSSAVYSAEKAVEDGYLEQTSSIQLARGNPGIKI